MIHLLGDVNTSEYEAAAELRRLILKAWPAVDRSTEYTVWLIAGAKCHGQPKRDIDVLLLANFGDDLTYTPFLPFSIHGQLESPYEVKVRSICAAIEVKGHPPEKVRIEGTNVKVYYREGWKDVTEQNYQQKFSVKNYIEHHGCVSPWVTSFIWLRNVPTVDLPAPPHNILGSNLTWDRFLNVLGQLHPPKWEYGSWTLSSTSSPSVISRVADLFTKPLEPTRLDRRRMELVSQRSVDNATLLSTLGHKMVILRGRGGTGKTMRLLQVAKQLYDEQNARILILTYNKALVADIRRLLTFMGIGDDIVEQSIQIQTVHSFFYAALQALEIIQPGEPAFLDRYEQFKDEALAYFNSGVLGLADVERLFQLATTDFSWDYIFIDEGQDWPINEQELLFHLYPHTHFLIADGIDQLIRTNQPANWGNRSRTSTQYLPLQTCLRMKSGLVRFVTSLAANLGLIQSGWQANSETPGGRIIIVEGNYLSDRALHDGLLEYNRSAGNRSVDMLFCISSRLVQRQVGNDSSFSLPGHLFAEWGYQVWDGAVADVRESYPTDLDQLRIVQYDSCRGLEGWVVVNLDFDEFYKQKLERYRMFSSRVDKLPSNEAEEAHLYASRWSLIPLTRAMDTLVIQVSGQPTPIREALQKAAETCRDLVEWRRSPS